MRSLKVIGTALLAGAISFASGPSSAGECVRLAAAGDGLTKDIAVIMSTAGLRNIIEGKGLKGQGEVQTSCKDGTLMTECRSTQMACK